LMEREGMAGQKGGRTSVQARKKEGGGGKKRGKEKANLTKT